MSKRIITHSGSFHADDVLGVAVLLLKYPGAEVVRSRSLEVINNADIVIDVGGVYDPSKLRFDHHQEGGAGTHPNGIPYASFGLVWKEFGEELSRSREVAEVIRGRLVLAIDAMDNGVSVTTPIFPDVNIYTIRDFFYSFLDYSKMSEAHLYETFIKATEIAKELLTREINKAHEHIEGMLKVKKALDENAGKGVIVLEEDLPWINVLVPIPEVLFVVYPRKEGNWGVKCVPAKLSGFGCKKCLPNSWAGKTGEEFKKISRVTDAIFCHKDRFIAAAESKEGAIALAEIALNA